jgi:hypothetical protein
MAVQMLRHTVATLAYRGGKALRGAPADFAQFRGAATTRTPVARFFAALKALDSRLASGGDLGFPAEKIFQGPIADALTHVGQIAMLRRMSGSPVRGESYFRAQIAAGRVH